MCMVDDLVPVDVAVRETFSTAEEFAGIETGNAVPGTENSEALVPVKVTPVTDNGSPPLLVTINWRPTPALTGTLPKSLLLETNGVVLPSVMFCELPLTKNPLYDPTTICVYGPQIFPTVISIRLSWLKSPASNL